MKFDFNEDVGITVLSLCDGNSGISHALTKNNYKIKHLYRSEIEKYGNANFWYNFDGAFPITDLGDLTKIDPDTLPKIDLLVCGFPCQSFSLSGKMGGIYNDAKGRGLIIFYVVEIIKKLKEKNPNLRILLENVVMRKDIQKELSVLIGNSLGLDILEPIKVNSKIRSPQSRTRLYWWNGDTPSFPVIDIVFKDIMEKDCSPEFDISDAHKNRVLNTTRGKGYFFNENSPKIGTINALYGKNPTDGSYIEQREIVKDVIKVGQIETSNNLFSQNRDVCSPDGIMQILTTCGGGGRHPKVAIKSGGEGNIKVGAFRGRYNKDGSTSQQLELRIDDKSNTLTTVQKDNVPVDLDNMRWRRVSVLEAERLQMMPDHSTEYGIFKDDKNYDPTLHNHLQKKKLSNTRRYHMLGNGFTITIIECFMHSLFNEVKKTERKVA